MRTPRRFRRLLPLVALLSVFAVIGLAPGVQAETPRVQHVTFSFPVDFVIDDLCAFPIAVSGEVSGHVTAFIDDEGNFTKVILHFSSALTWSANGTSIPLETGHWNEFDVGFNGSGAPSHVIETGLLSHLRLPNGRTVGVEVGRIVTDVATDSVIFRAGHSMSGQDVAAVCALF